MGLDKILRLDAETAGFNVTKMEPLVVSVKRKMAIVSVKSVFMVTDVTKNVNAMPRAQKIITNVNKTLASAVAKMDGMGACVCMNVTAIKMELEIPVTEKVGYVNVNKDNGQDKNVKNMVSVY